VFLGFATLRNGTYGSILLIGDRCIVVAKEPMDFIHDLFPLKHAPSANSEYAWLHRLLKRYKSPKKNSLTEDVEDVQGNEIAALDPSQEAEEVLTRSSKPVVLRSWRPLLILTTLLLLRPSSRFHPYCLHLDLHLQHLMLVAVRMIHLMKIWLLTMVTVIVTVTKTRMTIEVLFMQHVPWRTA
jgi:hypothetical protein